MTAVAEYQTDTTKKTGISRENAASAYWRELPNKENRHSGFAGFLKDEWHASGYFGSPKKRDVYPV